jgi:hypothetical protein
MTSGKSNNLMVLLALWYFSHAAFIWSCGNLPRQVRTLALLQLCLESGVFSLYLLIKKELAYQAEGGPSWQEEKSGYLRRARGSNPHFFPQKVG